MSILRHRLHDDPSVWPPEHRQQQRLCRSVRVGGINSSGWVGGLLTSDNMKPLLGKASSVLSCAAVRLRGRPGTHDITIERHSTLPVEREASTGGESVSQTDNYIIDDVNLLKWWLSGTQNPVLVLPLEHVPGALALAGSTFGHQGVARTTSLFKERYHWPKLREDARKDVVPCVKSLRPSEA